MRVICRVVKDIVRCYRYAKAQSAKVRAMNEAGKAERGVAPSHARLAEEGRGDAGSKDTPQSLT